MGYHNNLDLDEKNKEETDQQECELVLSKDVHPIFNNIFSSILGPQVKKGGK